MGQYHLPVIYSSLPFPKYIHSVIALFSITVDAKSFAARFYCRALWKTSIGGKCGFLFIKYTKRVDFEEICSYELVCFQEHICSINNRGDKRKGMVLIMENSQPNSMKELYEFMILKLGGEDSVKAEFFRNKIAVLDTSATRMGELFDEADRDGWGEWLRNLSLREFMRLVSPPEKRSKPVIARSGKRMTAAERDSLHRQILDYLGDHPWSLTSSVSTEVGMPTRTVGLHLKALREKGQVKTEGEKAKMRYALK